VGPSRNGRTISARPVGEKGLLLKGRSGKKGNVKKKKMQNRQLYGVGQNGVPPWEALGEPEISEKNERKKQ